MLSYFVIIQDKVIISMKSIKVVKSLLVLVYVTVAILLFLHLPGLQLNTFFIPGAKGTFARRTQIALECLWGIVGITPVPCLPYSLLLTIVPICLWVLYPTSLCLWLYWIVTRKQNMWNMSSRTLINTITSIIVAFFLALIFNFDIDQIFFVMHWLCPQPTHEASILRSNSLMILWSIRVLFTVLIVPVHNGFQNSCF